MTENTSTTTAAPVGAREPIDSIEKAVAQLRKSERGRRAIADLFQFLDSGVMLDGENKQAAAFLVAEAFTDRPGSVLGELRFAKGCK